MSEADWLNGVDFAEQGATDRQGSEFGPIYMDADWYTQALVWIRAINNEADVGCSMGMRSSAGMVRMSRNEDGRATRPLSVSIALQHVLRVYFDRRNIEICVRCRTFYVCIA